jgi:hypothetical protein
VSEKQGTTTTTKKGGMKNALSSSACLRLAVKMEGYEPHTEPTLSHCGEFKRWQPGCVRAVTMKWGQ